MYNVRVVIEVHHCARHQFSESLPITDTVQEDGDAGDGNPLCTGEIEGVVNVRLACITLTLKLLELDSGDVLERLAERGTWSENGSDESTAGKWKMDLPLMIAC